MTRLNQSNSDGSDPNADTFYFPPLAGVVAIVVAIFYLIAIFY